MSQYDNTNRGVLFINDRKEKETHPNLKGSINIDGKEYWLSAWTKEVQQGQRAGQKMISLSVQPKEQQQSQQQTQQGGWNPQPSGQQGGADEQDIPFDVYQKRMVV